MELPGKFRPYGKYFMRSRHQEVGGHVALKFRYNMPSPPEPAYGIIRRKGRQVFIRSRLAFSKMKFVETAHYTL